ncbi:MAG: DUF2132 domain-containing protein [Deltaproteobacteria bacterium]|nr:DUF2132 domain-containing protein [Deltaproteobacteria bacterium]
MTQDQPKNPLHGVTLKAIVEDLIDRYGWDELGKHLDLPCFLNEPSLTSSLKFLRKNLWAREKVEEFFVGDLKLGDKNRKRNARRAARRAYAKANAGDGAGDGADEDQATTQDAADVEPNPNDAVEGELDEGQ